MALVGRYTEQAQHARAGENGSGEEADNVNALLLNMGLTISNPVTKDTAGVQVQTKNQNQSDIAWPTTFTY